MASAPTAAGLESLSPTKRAALERMLLARRDAQAAARRIPKADPEAAAALSFAEKRLWLLDKLEPNHPFYNMPLAARVTGPLDRAAFSRSLRQLCSRHETLRYAYEVVEGQPRRTVHSESLVEPEFIDLRGQQTSAETLDERLRAEARRPFDLSRPPLLRCVVFELNDNERVVLLAMHHIVSDGWSMWVMLGELAAGYEAALRGLGSPPPPLAVQYSDYAVWQAERMTGERRHELVAYWKEQLADAPPLLELPTDRPRTAVQDFDGATHSLRIPKQVGQLLRQRAEEHQATPFMVLMAAYFAWLSRHTGQQDLLVGTVVANRDRAELEGLIGFFVGTLALRGNLSDDPTFAELIDQVRSTALDAYAHQELPFDQLIEAVAPERDQSHAALFQTALVVQNPPRDFAHGEGLSVEPIPVDNGTAKYDLTFFFWEDADGWTGHVEYRSSLFDTETIQRFSRSFLTLLEDGLQRLEATVSRLAVLDQQQRQTLSGFTNGAQTPFPDVAMHTLFEHSVARSPNKRAVYDKGQSLTYAQLDQRAAQMAAGLQRLGVGVGDPVIMSLPRSIDSIATMLAVMKSGGVYVPVDSHQAAKRREFVVKDTGARVMIAGDKESIHLDCRVLSPEDLYNKGEGQALRPPKLGPDSLAYIIYTSGSTGDPKGVPIQRRSIVNFMTAQLDLLRVTPEDRVLHGMSPAFDGGFSESFVPLVSGATMVIADREAVLDPGKLNQLMVDGAVSVAKFPPAVLASLDPARLTSLRTIVTGGDTLNPELARKWLPGRRFFNGYGPTEVTVGPSMHELRLPLTGRVPIGRPMANTRVYVLDEHRQPTPIGVAGEITIGGVGVSPGYLNRPEETAARFLPDPFAATPDARMYRTGDVGRWRADGELEFLGRTDDQVQLRGYRVEPGEVATALERLPQVDKAYVAVKPDGRGEQRLVAYVVPSQAGLSETEGEEQHVDAWQRLMDGSHRAAGALRDTQFDTTGWTSTYTGLPIPKEEMRHWAEAAASRVLALGPKNVLEIGCGTGLILLPVAPHCESYVGTDFLERSLAQLQQVVDAREGLAERVELHPLAADQLEKLSGRTFDTIVCNSVAQYFPSSDYLQRVLRQASELLAPGGRMFLGDLRNLRLHEAFAASVELTRADARLGRRELLGRIEAQLRREEELLIDPDFFESLRTELPRLGRVEVQLKQGDDRNELTRFRYDVVLHFDTPVSCAAPEVALDAGAVELSLDRVRRELTKNPETVVLTGLTNPRVDHDVDAWRRLTDGDQETPVSQLKELVASTPVGVTPDDWRRLAGEFGYRAEVRWGNEADRYDALLSRGESVSFPSESRPARDPAHLTNEPMQQKLLARLAPQLREGLSETLPQYMLPTAFVVLDAMPRTTNGKIDREALPPPPSGRPAWATGYVAPRDEEERLIAEAWEQLLGVSPVGAEDNFFDLGGHSMLAVQVMSEIETRSGRSLPLAALFQDPTVENLARLLRNPDAETTGTTLVPLQSSGDGAPLYCIHPAGGAVFCYQALASHFAGERPVIGVQAHGVDGRQPPHETMDAMASAYAEAIRSRQPDGPYHLCGWSLGGNIAYETARILREQGAEVGLVGLFDAGAIPPEESLQEEDLLPLLEALFPESDHATLEEIRGLAPEEQIAFFTERAAQAGLVDPAELAASQHIFSVFQNNVSAVHKHRAIAYPGDVVLFRAAEQTKTNALFDDPQLGWGPLVRTVRVLEVPSDHKQMMTPPQVDALAAMVKKELASS